MSLGYLRLFRYLRNTTIIANVQAIEIGAINIIKY